MAELDPHKKEQVEIAERLQLLLLQDFETLLRNHTITSTDRATLARLLMMNGWNIDPAQLPKSVQELLTSQVNPDEEDEDVLKFRKPA